MPAFHLPLTSGILATGMESAKVLQLFDALEIPNLKQQELSNILKELCNSCSLQSLASGAICETKRN
jgi:hypothetical protein